MPAFVFSVFDVFNEPCGCSGIEVEVPGLGTFRVYESVCFGKVDYASKEEPIVVFLRDETQVDQRGSDGEAKSGHEGPFLN